MSYLSWDISVFLFRTTFIVQSTPVTGTSLSRRQLQRLIGPCICRVTLQRWRGKSPLAIVSIDDRYRRSPHDAVARNATSRIAPRNRVVILFNCLTREGDQQIATCFEPDPAEKLQVERELRRQEQDYQKRANLDGKRGYLGELRLTGIGDVLELRRSFPQDMLSRSAKRKKRSACHTAPCRPS